MRVCVREEAVKSRCKQAARVDAVLRRTYPPSFIVHSISTERRNGSRRWLSEAKFVRPHG